MDDGQRQDPTADQLESPPKHEDDQLLERFKLLLEHGTNIPATSKQIDINVKPANFDEQLFCQAQQTCQKYYTNLSGASSAGLLLLLQLEPILIPLLKTGKSRTVSDLYDRYTATGKYIRKLYETNFYQSTSDGWTYLNLVRAMHLRVYDLMNANDNSDKGDDKADKLNPPAKRWVNQYDMALTQFAFVGLFLLMPEKCGAHKLRDRQLTHVAYYWHIISYYFGIEDRFNIFAYYEQPKVQKQYLEIILNHMTALERQPIGLEMALGFTLAFEDFSSLTNFNVLDHWWQPELSLSGGEAKPLSLLDRWHLMQFSFHMNVLFRSDTILSIMNTFYKRKFDRFCSSGSKIKAKLAKKYANCVYEQQDDSFKVPA